MTGFMSAGDSFDQDNITPCLDSSPSPTLLLEECPHDTCFKYASIPKMTTKNGLKLTAFLIDDDPTSQDDATLLPAAHVYNCQTPMPLIAACPKDIGIKDVPMTE